MLDLNNIRLDSCEKNALINALYDIEEEVYVTGSRTVRGKNGGDVDLLIFSKQNALNLSKKISRRFFMVCEEKIDVLVFDKDNLSIEQKSFINTLKLVRIK
ncbi:MAG: hypothetical protein KJ799_15005 [Bacteroidetes bacterium]|nr:hypothetical protein [Bacteroidota bacterium]